MQKFKILHTEASMGWGGQEIRVFKEALLFKKHKHWVGIAAHPESKIFENAKKRGIPVFPVLFKKNSVKNVFSVLRLVKKLDIQILHTHSSWDSWVGALVKLLYPKIKLVRTRHLSTPVKNHIFNKFLYKFSPDLIITTGDSIKEMLIKNLKVPENKVFSIPTGIELEKFNPEKVSPTILKKGFTIGTVSVLRSWKGHRYLLKAVPEIVKNIPNLRVYIVGEGPQRKNLENLIKELQIADVVKLLGHREDIPEILASFDLVIHPSTGHEGVPQTVLQALAMKKPVIATSVGSIPQVIKHMETGYLIPPKKPEAIKDAVLHLYENPELCKLLGEKGHKLVKKEYSSEGMLKKIEALYQRLY